MGSVIRVTLVTVLLLTSMAISGCWPSIKDYWAEVDNGSETDTIIPDSGECYETDDCLDAGS